MADYQGQIHGVKPVSIGNAEIGFSTGACVAIKLKVDNQVTGDKTTR